MDALTAQTSLTTAAGTTAITRVESVFDAVPDLQLYRIRWEQRCAHYQLLRSYARGTVYSDHPRLVRALKLYGGIRQILSPLKRAVRVDTAKVPGGWRLDPGNADEQRPAVPANVAAAVNQVRAWSNYRDAYGRAVQHGATAGEFALLVVDRQLDRSVQIVPLRPDEVVIGNFADATPFGLIIKPGLVDRAGIYEYAQLITPAEIRVYRSGVLVDQRANLQRRVPLVFSVYRAGEDGVGECAFAGAAEPLDRVNDAISQVLDVIQRNAEPLTVFSGVSDVDFDPENNAVVLPKADAKAYTVATNLVIGEAMEVIREVKGEFKNLLPQLIFDVLASRNDLAYDTVITLCSELIDHIKAVRTHVDMAVETAERWAIEAAQTMNLFPGVDASLHRLDPDRPVIEPGPMQQLALEQTRVGIEGARRAQAAPQPEAPSNPETSQDDDPAIEE